MNNYIKHIVEEFDFNAVNKQKKNISYKPAIDDMILNKILSIDGNKLYYTADYETSENYEGIFTKEGSLSKQEIIKNFEPFQASDKEIEIFEIE